MTNDAAETYLAGVQPRAVAVVTALDEAIREAHPAFDVAIKYKVLMYGLGGDWRHRVCAIGETNKGFALRFLAGVLMETRASCAAAPRCSRLGTSRSTMS